MAVQHFSEIASLRPSRRASAYRGLLRRMSYPWDSLANRITAKVPLDEREIEEITALLTSRCSARKREDVRLALMYLESVDNCGILDRVHVSKHTGRWIYTAGQSYPDEIRVVREHLAGW